MAYPHIYTIFEHPKDAPGSFVVRRFTAEDGRVRTSPWRYLYESLEDARASLISRGLHNVGRKDEDDPVIVESWL
jgi:hypothetical protein